MSATAASALSLGFSTDPGWRRLRFVLLVAVPGIVANALAAQMPGAVPFLIGNTAFITVAIRLGWRWGLLCALLVTAGFVEPRWTVLALAEALLVAFTAAGQGAIPRAWARIWLPLLLPALWLAKPASGDPGAWMLGVCVVLINGLVALLGARLIVQLSLAPSRRARQPLREQLGAQLAVAAATPVVLLMMLGLHLRSHYAASEQALQLRHQAEQVAAIVETFLTTHYRAVVLAARAARVPGDVSLHDIRSVYPEFTRMLAADAEGRIVQRAEAHPVARSDDASGRPGFDIPRITGQPFFGPVAEANGELTLAISAPLFGEAGGFAGVVEGRLTLRPLRDALREGHPVIPHEYAVLNAHGIPLFSSLDALPTLQPPPAGSPLDPALQAEGVTPPREVEYQRARDEVGQFGWQVVTLRPLGPVRAEQSAFSLLAALLCLALILLLKALARNVANQYAQPIGELVERQRALDLRDPATLHPLGLTGANCELQELIDGFDAMLQRLGELHVELTQALAAQEQLNRELEARVEQRTTELKHALVRSQHMAQARSVFLANMSHELRTPLTAIIGYTEHALRRGAPPSVWLETLRTIERHGQHLLGVVNDVLDASKMESGQLTVEMEPLSPLAIAEEAIALVAARAHEQGLDLQLAVQWPIPREVRGDRQRLRQILLNLLGNALKFTERGRVVVRIGAAAAAGQWWYDVEDTGVGIDAQTRARLFERFEQGDLSTTRRFGGTGLGLFISRELARRMGGEIEIQSERGRGSRFRVRLPLPEEPVWLDQRDPQPAAPSAAPDEVPRLGGRVLIAEDVADLRALIAAFVRATGAEVVDVDNGRQAYDRAMAERFDLLLLDMHMPVMDGREATSTLRADGYRGPIVALTADVIAEDVARYRAAGCDRVLAKPVDRAALYEVLREYLPPPAPTPSLDDPAIVAALAQLGERFRAQLPDEQRELQEAYRRGQREQLGEGLHRLKGSAGSFGAPQLSELAREAESALRDGDEAQLEQAMRALFDAIEAELR